MNKVLLPAILAFATIAACASGPEAPSYPAFIVADELPDLFLAGLPGVRAKEFAGDAQTRRVSHRIDLPAEWTGTTGGAPGKALEIFVLEGEITLADITLGEGGYAYVPPGSLGFNMTSPEGARVLYFLNDVNAESVIRAPIILDSGLLDWKPTNRIGVLQKELRADPGSGERTWLKRYEPGADIPWQSASASLEGYLVSGEFVDSECVDGKAYTGTYRPGGYFYRPPDAVHGGPAAEVTSEATWFLRRKSAAETKDPAACVPDEPLDD